ncbi:MAG: FAD-binding oxidoreductase [Desulfobacterales bacterium]|nr:FAD-binding oxidoreductase [Desulfobacterales bacterium]
MVSRALIDELGRIAGDRHVSESRTAAELYSYDASLAKAAPGAVVFPADSRQVADVVRAAARAGVPIVARGFGTNLSGGTILPHGGLTLCLSRMNRILGINPRSRTAVVQPGVTNLELQNALAPLGFFYAPDPASQKVSTLGGNVAENSGGPRCLKYGVTTNHVLGLEAILSDGAAVRLGGAAHDPAGFDLRALVIGSEGTLAVVTEVTVRITPRPEKVLTQLVVYDAVEDAARSVADIIAAGIVPATLEMMDAPIIRAVEDSIACGYPRDAAAVLIIEVEGPAAGLDRQADRIREICTANGCREVRDAADANARNRLWEGRRGAFGAVARLAPNYLVNDCVVPRTRLPEALAQVAAIAKKHGFEHGNVFHAGDGNLHPLILFDSRDPGAVDRVHAAGWEIMLACVALGGTISGEHGIGVEKMEGMRLVFSDDDIDAQRAVRRAVEPSGLLNPGKVLPDTSRPFAYREQAAWPAAVDALSAAEAEVAAAVVRAAAAGEALQVVGGGSLVGLGNAPARPLAPLRTEGLAAIAEIDPSNQFVSAGAGVTIDQLQAALAVHNQWLPLRPAFALGRRTLGGVTATGASGPERHAYGAPRKLLLGLRFVDGRGRLITAGGKVVKNVAGYDVTRLLAGSAGTLGVITRVVYRTATRPERCAMIAAAGGAEACSDLAAQALGSSLGAVFATAEPDDGAGRWRLRIGFEGFAGTVAAQLARAGALLAAAGFEDAAMADYDVLDGPFGDLYDRIARHPFVVRAGVPADRAAEAAGLLRRRAGEGPMLIDYGFGRILFGAGELGDAVWPEVGERVRALDGHLQMEKAPDAFKGRHEVFGPARPEWRLMHRVKEALDPRGIFSPGTMPGRR